LLIGKRCQIRMRPGVDAELMTGHVLFQKNSRKLDRPRANNEESGK